jgi:uncharacterized protein YkwD
MKQRVMETPMFRKLSALLVVLLAVAACDVAPRVDENGNPLPQVYRIRGGEKAKVQFRMLDSVNSLRAAAGVPAVELDPKLTAAAATHARDMAVQNRPWHFGSDGSSPIDRVARVGYEGPLIGETISETFETELETLAAWMEQEGTRRVIMSPDATKMGFSWHQENNGKLWWTLVMGGSAPAS